MGSFEKSWDTSIEFAMRFPVELLGGVLFGFVLGWRLPAHTLSRDTVMPPLFESLLLCGTLFFLMLLAEWISTREPLWRIAAIVKSASVGGLCLLAGTATATLVNRR